MILGCDAAGLDEDGNEVVVHAVISSDSWRGDETFDPRRSLLSERYQGALAEKVAVPRANVAAQATGAVLRAGGVPADGVADRLPDAVHARQGRPRADDPRAGRERRRRHRADRAGERRRRPRVGHRALGGQARAGAQARRRPGVRVRRAAARARRRGVRDDRQGDLGSLDPFAASPAARSSSPAPQPATRSPPSSPGSSSCSCRSSARRWAPATSSSG